MMKEKRINKKEEKRVWIMVGIIVGILIFLIILLSLIQIPYTAYVSFNEQEPYQTNEYYNEQISTLGCDSDYSCSCLHSSCLHYGGLFGWGDCDNWACDSCKCQRERSITAYREVVKTREETRYCALGNRIRGLC